MYRVGRSPSGLGGARWCLVVLGGARWCLVVLGGAWWYLVSIYDKKEGATIIRMDT